MVWVFYWLGSILLCGCFPFVISKDCSSDYDCSLNGVCISSQCVCSPAWRSDPDSSFGCSKLSLLNPVRGTGLHSVESDGKNTSSWGGSSLFDESSNLYHMFSSQMVRHCGISAWTTNSHVVRATSPSAWGPYTRVAENDGEVFPVFSHEPNAVRDPTTKEWALFFTLKSPDGPGRPLCNCSDGSSVACPATGAEGPTVVSWAASPAGPWSPPLLIKDMGGRQSDTNLAAVILPDGSLVGIWRVWDGSQEICKNLRGGSCPLLVTAEHWKNASTYVFSSEPLFPDLSSYGSEDPALYLDAAGHFHALFHNMDPPAADTAGGHAFSANGVNWTYTGVAYNASGFWDDGTPFSFSRRERPHPIMAADGVTIVALSSGVTYEDSTTHGGDACFTFVQPVST